jgi:hypothetical protein
MGGSCGLGGPFVLIGMRLKQLAEPRAEHAVEDCAADLQQEVGTASGPSHLLGFVHAAIDEKVGSSLGDRRANAEACAVPSGVVDEPTALTSQVLVDVVQRMP